MSDTVLKIVPTDPAFVPKTAAARRAVKLLESLLPDGGECEAEFFPELEFIDQGENLSTVLCPACKRGTKVLHDESTHEWWHGVTDAAQEGGYEGFTFEMPCCRQTVRFTDLTFDWPGAFARFQLAADDPQIDRPLPPDQVKQLARVLGCELQQVWAHY